MFTRVANLSPKTIAWQLRLLASFCEADAADLACDKLKGRPKSTAKAAMPMCFEKPNYASSKSLSRLKE
jgi:hypothetical protein